MKKLLFAALLALSIPAISQAQAVTRMGNAQTVVSTATTTYFPARMYGTGTLTVQCLVKNVSGTTAGTFYLQGSIDSNVSPKTWVNIPNSASNLRYDVDTISGSGLTAYKIVCDADYLHYRGVLVTTGTQSDTVNVYGYLKNKYHP